MPEVPATTDRAAAEFNSVVHAAIFDVVIRAARADAVANFPWLAWPICSQVFGLALNWFGGLVYESLATAGTFAIIDAQTQRELDDYRAAIERARTAPVSVQPQAIEEVRAAFARLIHFDGSAPA